MKKLNIWGKGIHYNYKGYTIYKEKEIRSERKYSYTNNNGESFGHAPTLELAMAWIRLSLNK